MAAALLVLCMLCVSTHLGSEDLFLLCFLRLAGGLYVRASRDANHALEDSGIG